MINVCLIFNVAIICSSKYFRFLFVKLSLKAIGLKIGEAHRTRSSSLYSANIIGAPMHPAAIGVAVRTGSDSRQFILNGEDIFVKSILKINRTNCKLMLKVVGNEKRGGSGSKLLIEYGNGPWRSMSV